MNERIFPPDPPFDLAMPATGRIGDILVAAGMLTPDQVETIVHHADRQGLRFGEAAIDLELVDEGTVQRALATQLDMRVGSRGLDGEPIAFTDPHSPAAEDYRSIRSALTLRWFQHAQGLRTLATISPRRGDGRSLITANLAVSFAQGGFRTLLIDADMRHPTQHQLFRLDNRLGLSNYLSGYAQQQVFQPVGEIPTLTVITAGTESPNPQELLLRPAFDTLIAEVRMRFDMVLFDTPSAESGGDHQIVGAKAGGALVITRCEQTRMRDVKKLVAACRDFGIRIAGSAMLRTR